MIMCLLYVGGRESKFPFKSLCYPLRNRILPDFYCLVYDFDSFLAYICDYWSLRFFFLMWTIFKAFIEFVTTMLLFYVLVFWLRGTWDLSAPTRDQTHTPCIGRWNLNRWTTREVPIIQAFERRLRRGKVGRQQCVKLGYMDLSQTT